MYPTPKDKIVQEYKEKFGVSLNADSDFTKLPDEVLVNAHLYGFYDKVSIQANVEMSRRLKNEIKEMNDSTKKYSERLIWLTWILVGIGIITIAIMVWQVFLI